MEAMDKKQEKVDVVDVQDEHTLKGTLFATLFFVGGGILSFMLLLFILYMTRI